jgi:ribosomal-protein-alanine N-acetyltransferase
VLIRNATHADIPQIIALEREAATAAHWSAREYEMLFASTAAQRIVLIACEEPGHERVSGFLIARCLSGEWEIENLVTTTLQRRAGVGSKLVRELIRRAREQCVTSVLLEVRESNLAARQLYKKVGFVEEGRRSNYYRNPEEDAQLLRFLLQECDKTA